MKVSYLGRQDYVPLWKAMQDFTDDVQLAMGLKFKGRENRRLVLFREFVGNHPFDSIHSDQGLPVAVWEAGEADFGARLLFSTGSDRHIEEFKARAAGAGMVLSPTCEP